MARAPRQILVLPYRFSSDGSPEYLILLRSDLNFWQGIAGGAEDEEASVETARRESFEEVGIPKDSKIWKLDSLSTVPANVFSCWREWPQGTYVVPEFYFAVEFDLEVKLSSEHKDFKWCSYDEARKLLKWDSNRNALWELNHRLLLTV